MLKSVAAQKISEIWREVTLGYYMKYELDVWLKIKCHRNYISNS